MRPLALQAEPYGEVLRTSGRFLKTFSGRPQDVTLPSGFSQVSFLVSIVSKIVKIKMDCVRLTFSPSIFFKFLTNSIC